MEIFLSLPNKKLNINTRPKKHKKRVTLTIGVIKFTHVVHKLYNTPLKSDRKNFQIQEGVGRKL